MAAEGFMLHELSFGNGLVFLLREGQRKQGSTNNGSRSPSVARISVQRTGPCLAGVKTCAGAGNKGV